MKAEKLLEVYYWSPGGSNVSSVKEGQCRLFEWSNWSGGTKRYCGVWGVREGEEIRMSPRFLV